MMLWQITEEWLRHVQRYKDRFQRSVTRGSCAVSPRRIRDCLSHWTQDIPTELRCVWLPLASSEASRCSVLQLWRVQSSAGSPGVCCEWFWGSFGCDMLWRFIHISHSVLVLKAAKYLSKLVKSILKSSKMHSHMQSLQMVISHPSSLLEASQNGCTMLQAACWRELYHGSGNMDQILAKKTKTCRSVGRSVGYTSKFEVSNNSKLETKYILGIYLFPWFHLLSTVFLPRDSLLILFHKFPLHWKYLHILIFQLFHLVHGTSLYQFPIDFEVVSAPTGAGKWSTWFYESSRLVGRELQSRNPKDCAVWVSHFGNARTLIRPMNHICLRGH